MSNAIEARPIFDYLRVAVACLSYLAIEPLFSAVFGFVPSEFDFVLSLFAVAASAAVSWVIFNLIDLRTHFTFTWMQAADGNTFGSDVVDLAAGPAQQGQIVFVQVERASPTFLARKVFAWLVTKELCVEFGSNQQELRFLKERENAAVEIQSNRVRIRMTMSDHSSNTVTFDLGMRWDGVLAPELVASLKYQPIILGSLWVKLAVAVLIKLSPSVKSIRKAQSSV